MYVPQLQVVKETVEISQLLFVEKIVVIPDDPLSLVKSLITDMINTVQSEGTGASADKNQFARMEAVITNLISHVMRGTVQAEARQPHRGSKQQPSQAGSTREREREEKKGERAKREGKRTEGRKSERESGPRKGEERNWGGNQEGKRRTSRGRRRQGGREERDGLDVGDDQREADEEDGPDICQGGWNEKRLQMELSPERRGPEEPEHRVFCVRNIEARLTDKATGARYVDECEDDI